MQVPRTHSDIITELLYAHERATVLYHALLVSDRNSSDQKNNRLALQSDFTTVMRVIDYSIRVSGWFLQNPGDTREMRVSWKVWSMLQKIETIP